MSQEIPERFVGWCVWNKCCYMLRAARIGERGHWLKPACALTKLGSKFDKCPIDNWRKPKDEPPHHD